MGLRGVVRYVQGRVATLLPIFPLCHPAFF